jgi:pyrroloquinoline quinone (PQQ) biosynthesis protein C
MQKDLIQKLNSFISEWEEEYTKQINKILLFNSKTELNSSQKESFVRYFYHIRGHFNQLLFVFADCLPKEVKGESVRKSILENLEAELGNLAGFDTHNNYYYNFAKSVCIRDLAVTEEIEEISYLNWIKDYNKEHKRFCYANSYSAVFGAMYAYEFLDNIDYNILYSFVSDKYVNADLKFFEVHKGASHAEMVEKDLSPLLINQNDLESIQQGFQFIGSHQLQMWQNLSKEILK